MADTIIDGTLFNAEIIKYSSPKANASGGKSINILNSETNSGLRLSTPLMLTWGAGDFVDQSTGKGNGKFEMALQFPSGEYATEDTRIFLEKMIAMEQKIKDDALIHSKEWFGKVHKNAEVVEALYSPMLKYSKDKFTGEPDYNKAPTLKVKMTIWEGVWKCLICDEDGEKLYPSHSGLSPLDYIKKGTNLVTLMQCGGIWFANGKFGVTWKLVQALVQKPKASLLDECLIKFKPSEKEKLKTLPQPVVDVLAEPRSTAVLDSDCEDEEEDQDLDQPNTFQETTKAEVVMEMEAAVISEEPKKVVKKVVKKKGQTSEV